MLEDKLAKILREEELKWLQRSKDLMEGDSNTKYFQIKASDRKRKNKIVFLHQEEGVIEGDENLLKYITVFYNNLFGPASETPISLNFPFMPKLSDQDKILLTQEFSME